LYGCVCTEQNVENGGFDNIKRLAFAFPNQNPLFLFEWVAEHFSFSRD
jgi:hypothetical protein